MKKTNNYNTIYRNISKQEAALLGAAGPLLVFSLSDIKKLTGWEKNSISNVLFSLKKKKIVLAPKKDHYVLAEKVPAHLYSIAVLLTSPSYVSFWSACSYYGFTEQQLSAIQVASVKQHPKLKIAGHAIETTTLQPKKWFGYRKIEGFAIAEVEKLLIDCLHQPDKAGGIPELRKILAKAWSQTEQNKFYAYLKKFENRSIFARAGFLLEELKLANHKEKLFQKNLPLSYVRLNPSKQPVKKYNHKWRIIIND